MKTRFGRNRPRPQGDCSPKTSKPRPMCFACRRPANLCHCSLIPTIHNKTQIVIAQHIRERSHPFNTARMVNRALTNAKLIVDYSENIDRHTNIIDSNAALLYPSKNAVDIANVPVAELPRQLILLDGTWNQVRRLYRNWPALWKLPHYRICPTSPGQYRIRLEPDDYSLSTVEAAVAALTILEPDTSGIDKLLAAFRTMVERQLDHPNAEYESSLSRPVQKINIPSVLFNDFSNVVVAYGEAAPVDPHRTKRQTRRPVFWVAKRIVSGERFSAAIQSDLPLTDELLGHFDLSRDEFSDALTVRQFEHAWKRFSRPDDILTVYNGSTLRLLTSIDIRPSRTIELKSVNYDPERRFRTITSFLQSNRFVMESPEFPGRAGRRLAGASSLCRYLEGIQTEERCSCVRQNAEAEISLPDLASVAAVLKCPP